MLDVSVITVVRNALRDGRREKFGQCIDSVRAQKGVSIEHLIVDGASDDGTLEFIRAFGGSSPSLRVISEKDDGIYHAMNRGLEHARGRYVIFLNSDDFYHDPMGLCESFHALERTSCDFSYAPARVLRALDDKPIDHPNCHPCTGRIFVDMEFSHQSVMVRRESLLAIGGFDTRYRSAADYDSVLRLILAGRRGCCVPRSFVSFRMGGFSCVNQDAAQRETGEIFAALYNRYAAAGLSHEDGLRLHLAGYLPFELKERLFPFYVASFGGGMLAAEADGAPMPSPRLHRLLAFKHRLLPLKKGIGAETILHSLLPALARHPIWFVEFAFRYRQECRRIGRRDAAREAFGVMGRRLLAKRRGALNLRVLKRAASVQLPEEARMPDSGGGSLLPVRMSVSPSDFWNVYGIYEDEPWGAWAARRMVVKTHLPEMCVGRDLSVALHVGGYVFAASPKRLLRVGVNSVALPPVEIDHVEPRCHRLKIPASAVVSPAVDFCLELDADFVPAELGHSTDVRRLGIAFGGLGISLEKRRPTCCLAT